MIELPHAMPPAMCVIGMWPQVMLRDYKAMAKYLRDRFECEGYKEAHNLESDYSVNEVVNNS